MFTRKQLMLMGSLLIIAAILVGLKYWLQPKKNTPADQAQSQPRFDQYSQTGIVQKMDTGSMEFEVSVPRVNMAGVAEPNKITRYASITVETLFEKKTKDGLIAIRPEEIKPGQSVIVYTKQSVNEVINVHADKIVIE